VKLNLMSSSTRSFCDCHVIVGRWLYQRHSSTKKI
jgi:hypothetical protein